MPITPVRPLAVVTGASSGIGRELATQLALRGHDLIVAAEDDGIEAVAGALRDADQHAHVEPVQVDLATEDGVKELHRHITDSGVPVEVLVLNAGRGNNGPFTETSLRDDMEQIDLNVRETVHLAKLVLPAMKRAGRGRVLVVSSIASTMPGPNQSIYNATKSFLQSWAVAIRSELADSGVTVTSLMPGPTKTGFFARANLLDTKMGANPTDEPDDVARQGLEALFAGQERVIASTPMSKVQGKIGRFVPDRVKAELHKRVAAPGSAR